MKHLKVFLLLLLVAPSASAQTDSTQVKNDSITWNQELEGVTVKAQRQLLFSAMGCPKSGVRILTYSIQ